MKLKILFIIIIIIIFFIFVPELTKNSEVNSFLNSIWKLIQNFSALFIKEFKSLIAFLSNLISKIK